MVVRVVDAFTRAAVGHERESLDSVTCAGEGLAESSE